MPLSQQQIDLLNRYYGAPLLHSGGGGGDDPATAAYYTTAQGTPDFENSGNITYGGQHFATPEAYYQSLIDAQTSSGRAPGLTRMTVAEGGPIMMGPNGPIQGIDIHGNPVSSGVNFRGNPLIDLNTYNQMFGTNYSDYGGISEGGLWRGNASTNSPFDTFMQNLAMAGVGYGSGGAANAILGTMNSSPTASAGGGAGNSGLSSLLPLLAAMSGGQSQTPTAPSMPSDPFAGQNQFSANPLSPDQVYGGIAPIPLNLQTDLKRLSVR